MKLRLHQAYHRRVLKATFGGHSGSWFGVSAGLGSNRIRKAGAGAISNVAGQLAVTGKVDPLSALAIGVTAGINPGGMLAENFGVA